MWEGGAGWGVGGESRRCSRRVRRAGVTATGGSRSRTTLTSILATSLNEPESCGYTLKFK